MSEQAETQAQESQAVENTEAAAETVVETVAETVSDVATDAAETVAEAVAETTEPIVDAASDAVEAAAEPVADAVEAVVEADAEPVADAVEAVAKPVADAVEPAAETVTDAVETSADAAASKASTDTAPAAKTASATETDAEKRQVRVLSVGLEVDGVVKRTTEFGAFVDIGVGRDGLVHISELSVRRVAKVSDVLKEGQEVVAWIKQLDRERNRISLTLIPPGTTTIRDLEKGDLVTGTVSRIVPYGAFIDIGVGRDALLHIREMAEGYVKRPEDVVSVGEEVEARVIELSKRRGRIDLSIKGLRPEPEQAEAPTAAAGVEEEESMVDDFADVEVLSPMELAFQKAMAEGGDEVTGTRRKMSKKARKAELQAIQDEIVSRTIEDTRDR